MHAQPDARAMARHVALSIPPDSRITARVGFTMTRVYAGRPPAAARSAKAGLCDIRLTLVNTVLRIG